MDTSYPTTILWLIILLTGIFTIPSDVKYRRIYNKHLVIGTVLGAGVMVYMHLAQNGQVSLHLLNSLIALAIGLFCFRTDIWKGGDAKLYTLYAFLMPNVHSNPTLGFNSLNLFACSFIAGTILIIPLFQRNFSSYCKSLDRPERYKSILVNLTVITVLISWVLSPGVHFIIDQLAKNLHPRIVSVSPYISLILTYMVFAFVRRFQKIMRQINPVIGGTAIAAGIFVRTWLTPDSLSWPSLTHTLFRIGLFSALSACVYISQTDLKNYSDRVAFAPLLFLGCVLSYTPFLEGIINLLYRI